MRALIEMPRIAMRLTSHFWPGLGIFHTPDHGIFIAVTQAISRQLLNDIKLQRGERSVRYDQSSTFILCDADEAC
jgi:hypothetical protein